MYGLVWMPGNGSWVLRMKCLIVTGLYTPGVFFSHNVNYVLLLPEVAVMAGVTALPWRDFFWKSLTEIFYFIGPTMFGIAWDNGEEGKNVRQSHLDSLPRFSPRLIDWGASFDKVLTYPSSTGQSSHWDSNPQQPREGGT